MKWETANLPILRLLANRVPVFRSLFLSKIWFLRKSFEYFHQNENLLSTDKDTATSLPPIRKYYNSENIEDFRKVQRQISLQVSRRTVSWFHLINSQDTQDDMTEKTTNPVENKIDNPVIMTYPVDNPVVRKY